MNIIELAKEFALPYWVLGKFKCFFPSCAQELVAREAYAERFLKSIRAGMGQ